MENPPIDLITDDENQYLQAPQVHGLNFCTFVGIDECFCVRMTNEIGPLHHSVMDTTPINSQSSMQMEDWQAADERSHTKHTIYCTKTKTKLLHGH